MNQALNLKLTSLSAAGEGSLLWWVFYCTLLLYVEVNPCDTIMQPRTHTTLMVFKTITQLPSEKRGVFLCLLHLFVLHNDRANNSFLFLFFLWQHHAKAKVHTGFFQSWTDHRLNLQQEPGERWMSQFKCIYSARAWTPQEQQSQEKHL